MLVNTVRRELRKLQGKKEGFFAKWDDIRKPEEFQFTQAYPEVQRYAPVLVRLIDSISAA